MTTALLILAILALLFLPERSPGYRPGSKRLPDFKTPPKNLTKEHDDERD